MTGDSAGLLLVIDRLGRTIAELEARNAELARQLAERSETPEQS